MKKITFTIGIPAYNEEQNIESFLRSFFEQDLKKIDLEQILVYSDASSDKTNSIVKELSKTFPLIKLINGSERKGKYFRVNELFKKNKSEVLVVLDADIALAKKDFFEKLVTTLISDKNSSMIAAHVELVRPDGFWAKVLYTTFTLGDYVRLSVPGYDVAANFHGAATAYKKEFIHTVNIPANLSDPHLFIYLSAKRRNGFRYCPEAVILQIPPSTMRDVTQLMRRSIGKKDAEIEKIFGKEMLENMNIFTTRGKISGLWKSFLKEPLYTPVAIIMNFYLGRMARKEKADKSPIWKINTSTKKRITYAK